jgi:phage protein U
LGKQIKAKMVKEQIQSKKKSKKKKSKKKQKIMQEGDDKAKKEDFSVELERLKQDQTQLAAKTQ